MKTNNYLTTKEFIKAVEEWGLDLSIEDDEDYLFIKDVDGEVIANINKTIPFQLCTDYRSWDDLCDEDKEDLFKLFTAYSSTPIDER